MSNNNKVVFSSDGKFVSIYDRLNTIQKEREEEERERKEKRRKEIESIMKHNMHLLTALKESGGLEKWKEELEVLDLLLMIKMEDLKND